MRAAEYSLESGKTTYGTEKLTGSAPSERVNSWQFSSAVLIANTVGVAGLTAASAVDDFGGFIPGSIGILFVVALNAHMSIILWRLYMCFPESATYLELVDAAFAESTRFKRQVMEYATGIAQYGYIFGCIAFNLMTIGRGIGNFGGAWHICLPTMMLVALLVCLPFQLTMRSIHGWKGLTWCCMIAAFLLFTIPLVYFMVNGVRDVRVAGSHVYTFNISSLGNVLSGMSSICFNLSTQYLLVEVMSEMKNPAELPRSYGLIVGPFQTVMFLAIGLGGYYFLGSAGTGTLTSYMPFGPSLFLTGIFYEISMIVANLINCCVLCRAAHHWFSPDCAEDGSGRDWTRWTAIVLVAMGAGWFVANLIPFFTDFVDILGTTLAPVSCYVIPVVTYVHCYWNSKIKLPRISVFEWFLITVEFVIILMLIFYGTWVVGSNIIASWTTFGYPFQCNCESLWDTCACSATRPGMVEKCFVPPVK